MPRSRLQNPRITRNAGGGLRPYDRASVDRRWQIASVHRRGHQLENRSGTGEPPAHRASPSPAGAVGLLIALSCAVSTACSMFVNVLEVLGRPFSNGRCWLTWENGGP